MRERIFAKVGHISAGLHHYVILGSETFGHFGTREVGDSEEKIAHLVFTFGKAILQTLCSTLDACHLFFHFLRFLFLTLLHKGADRRGEFFKLGSVGIAFLLQTAALRVDFQYFGYNTTPVEAFDGKTADHKFGIILDRLEGKHILLLLFIFFFFFAFEERGHLRHTACALLLSSIP